MAVILTEKAAGEVKRIIEEQKFEDDMVLRIGVTGGGCSGFSYSLGFDKNYDEKNDRYPRQMPRVRQVDTHGFDEFEYNIAEICWINADWMLSHGSSLGFYRVRANRKFPKNLTGRTTIPRVCI